MVGKEKTMKSHVRGGSEGPDIKTMNAGGATKVNVTVMLMMQDTKCPRALTTLRVCLLLETHVLSLKM